MFGVRRGNHVCLPIDELVSLVFGEVDVVVPRQSAFGPDGHDTLRSSWGRSWFTLACAPDSPRDRSLLLGRERAGVRRSDLDPLLQLALRLDVAGLDTEPALHRAA